MIRIAALNDSSSNSASSNHVRRNQHQPITTEAQEHAAHSMYTKALAHQRQGNIQRSADILEQLLICDYLRQKQSQVGEATTSPNAPVCLPPHLTLKYSVLKNLAEIRASEGRMDEALDALLQAQELDGTEVSVLYKIGTLAKRTGNYPLSALALQQGLEIRPEHMPCLHSIISILYVINNYEACLDYIARSLNRDAGYVHGLVVREAILNEQPSLNQLDSHFLNKHSESLLENVNEYTTQIDELERDEVMSPLHRMRSERLAKQQPRLIPHIILDVEQFSWPHVGEALVSLYEKILDSDTSLASVVDIITPQLSPQVSSRTEPSEPMEVEQLHNSAPEDPVEVSEAMGSILDALELETGEKVQSDTERDGRIVKSILDELIDGVSQDCKDKAKLKEHNYSITRGHVCFTDGTTTADDTADENSQTGLPAPFRVKRRSSRVKSVKKSHDAAHSSVSSLTHKPPKVKGPSITDQLRQLLPEHLQTADDLEETADGSAATKEMETHGSPVLEEKEEGWSQSEEIGRFISEYTGKYDVFKLMERWVMTLLTRLDFKWDALLKSTYCKVYEAYRKCYPHPIAMFFDSEYVKETTHDSQLEKLTSATLAAITWLEIKTAGAAGSYDATPPLFPQDLPPIIWSELHEFTPMVFRALELPDINLRRQLTMKWLWLRGKTLTDSDKVNEALDIYNTMLDIWMSPRLVSENVNIDEIPTVNQIKITPVAVREAINSLEHVASLAEIVKLEKEENWSAVIRRMKRAFNVTILRRQSDARANHISTLLDAISKVYEANRYSIASPSKSVQNDDVDVETIDSEKGKLAKSRGESNAENQKLLSPKKPTVGERNLDSVNTSIEDNVIPTSPVPRIPKGNQLVANPAIEMIDSEKRLSDSEGNSNSKESSTNFSLDGRELREIVGDIVMKVDERIQSQEPRNVSISDKTDNNETIVEKSADVTLEKKAETGVTMDTEKMPLIDESQLHSADSVPVAKNETMQRGGNSKQNQSLMPSKRSPTVTLDRADTEHSTETPMDTLTPTQQETSDNATVRVPSRSQKSSHEGTSHTESTVEPQTDDSQAVDKPMEVGSVAKQHTNVAAPMKVDEPRGEDSSGERLYVQSDGPAAVKTKYIPHSELIDVTLSIFEENCFMYNQSKSQAWYFNLVQSMKLLAEFTTRLETLSDPNFGELTKDVIQKHGVTSLIAMLLSIISHEKDSAQDKNASNQSGSHKPEQTGSHKPEQTAFPWIILSNIVHLYSQDTTDSKSLGGNHGMLPAEIRLLILGHEWLAKNAICCISSGVLLLHTTNLLLHNLTGGYRDTEQFSSTMIYDMKRQLEQCLYCLFGHPPKRVRHLVEHNTKRDVALPWKLARVLYLYYRPTSMPEFDSFKSSTISSDLEYLIRKVSAATPNDLMPPQTSSDVIVRYLDAMADISEVMDLSSCIQEKGDEVFSSMYYLLGDYYFKNKQPFKAVKHYLLDLYYNPKRFDGWAGMALARCSRLEQRLSGAETLAYEGLFAKLATSTLQSFRCALSLQPGNSKLWIEYAGAAYQLHSFASRACNAASREERTEQELHMLEKLKEDMLDKSHEGYKSVERLTDQSKYEEAEDDDWTGEQEEAWLYQYMFGKISEKKGEGPEMFLNHYMQSCLSLADEGAQYPRKVSYIYTPPHLALESVELHYRVHTSILKNVLAGPCSESDLELYREVINKMKNSAFVTRPQQLETQSKSTSSTQQSNTTPTRKRSNTSPSAMARRAQRPGDRDEIPSVTTRRQYLLQDIHETVREVMQGLLDQVDHQVTQQSSESIVQRILLELLDEVMTETEKTSAGQPATLASDIDVEPLELNEDEDVQSVLDNLLQWVGKSDTSVAQSSESSNPTTSDSLSHTSVSAMSAEDLIICDCASALKLCITRYPLHYKSYYRLALLHLREPRFKDLNKAEDILLGCGGRKKEDKYIAQGLFQDRKHNNFFNGVWRVPIQEIERAGSFSSHLSKTITLLLQLLHEKREYTLLYHLHTQLYRTPIDDKKFLLEVDRIHHANKALEFAIHSLYKVVSITEKTDVEILAYLHQAYKWYNYCHKIDYCIANVHVLLVKGYKTYKSKADEEFDCSSKVDITEAKKFCQHKFAASRSAQGGKHQPTDELVQSTEPKVTKRAKVKLKRLEDGSIRKTTKPTVEAAKKTTKKLTSGSATDKPSTTAKSSELPPVRGSFVPFDSRVDKFKKPTVAKEVLEHSYARSSTSQPFKMPAVTAHTQTQSQTSLTISTSSWMHKAASGSQKNLAPLFDKTQRQQNTSRDNKDTTDPEHD